MPTAHKVLSHDALERDETSDSEKAEIAQLQSYGEGDRKVERKWRNQRMLGM